MEDFQMMCETMVRKLFQCGRFDDPLRVLANADDWTGLYDPEFSTVHFAKAWAVLARLRLEYLDSVPKREELYSRAKELEAKLIKAQTNREIMYIMQQINEIVIALNLSEFPHISYRNTNDVHK